MYMYYRLFILKRKLCIFNNIYEICSPNENEPSLLIQTVCIYNCKYHMIYI